MRYIDFEGKTPANTAENPYIPSWRPWSIEEWNSWLSESGEYLCELEKLHGSGSEDEINARNNFIDSKSDHWGKLKIWLQVLSYGKCWFSEVRDKYSHYDVEHFRPKKIANGLNKSENRDGYWWLAFEYTNYRLCGNVGNRKKGGWFPLKEDSVKSTPICRCEESEVYYLLDPADIHDPGLLAFNEEGNAIPAHECTTWEKERALETIKRLKLSAHEMLTEARKKLWQEITIEIDQFLTAKSKLSTGSNPGIKEKVKAHAKKIMEYTQPSSELSSVARYCILLRNEPCLTKLIA